MTEDDDLSKVKLQLSVRKSKIPNRTILNIAYIAQSGSITSQEFRKRHLEKLQISYHGNRPKPFEKNGIFGVSLRYGFVIDKVDGNMLSVGWSTKYSKNDVRKHFFQLDCSVEEISVRNSKAWKLCLKDQYSWKEFKEKMNDTSGQKNSKKKEKPTSDEDQKEDIGKGIIKDTGEDIEENAEKSTGKDVEKDNAQIRL